MKQRPLTIAVVGAVATLASEVTLAQTCPAPVGGVITVVGAVTDAAGCQLAAGESIRVEDTGTINIQEGAGSGTLRGIWVQSGVTAADVQVDGNVAVGNTNNRFGIEIEGSLTGALTVNGGVVANGSSSRHGVGLRGGIAGGTTIAGTVRSNSRGIYTDGPTQSSLSITSTGIVEGEQSAVFSLAPISTFQNAGTLRAPDASSGGGFDVRGNINQFRNSDSGSITSRDKGFGAVTVDAQVNLLENRGAITATGTGGSGIAVLPLIRVNRLANLASGSITSTASAADSSGVRLAGGEITTLDNDSTISGAVDGIRLEDESFYGIKYAEITTLTNLGTLSGGTGAGINDQSDMGINRLINAQSDLTLTGNLPANYDIVISSTSNFGKLAATAIGARISTFGIDVTNSMVTDDRLYPGVLSGVPAANLSATSGTSGAFSWVLQNPSGQTTTWDLCVGDCSAGGDTDGDGINDGEDDFPNADTEVSGDGATLTTTPGASDSSCSIDESSFDGDAVHPSPEDPLLIPLGRAVAFTLSGCSVGESIDVAIDFGTALATGSTVHKVDDAAGWSAPIASAAIEGSIVRYTVTDGGPLDQDGVANGTIVDPVSVAQAPGSGGSTAEPVPALPGVFAGLLAALLGLFGIGRVRKRAA